MNILFLELLRTVEREPDFKIATYVKGQCGVPLSHHKASRRSEDVLLYKHADIISILICKDCEHFIHYSKYLFS